MMEYALYPLCPPWPSSVSISSYEKVWTKSIWAIDFVFLFFKNNNNSKRKSHSIYRLRRFWYNVVHVCLLFTVSPSTAKWLLRLNKRLLTLFHDLRVRQWFIRDYCTHCAHCSWFSFQFSSFVFLRIYISGIAKRKSFTSPLCHTRANEATQHKF